MQDRSTKPWFLASIAITLFVIGLLGWNLIASHNLLTSFKNQELSVERASWKLQLFAETMTMATRVSVLSGNLKWQDVYEETRPKLEKVLQRLPKLLDDPEIVRKTERISGCLQSICRLEEQAFSLIKHGDKQEAIRLMAGWEFTKNQLRFSRLTEQLASLIQARLDQKVSFQKTQNTALIGLTAACLLALILLWTVTVNRWRSQIRARLDSEKEKRKLQSQLLQAQKMESVGRLAGGVAHEFNNLLQGMLGNVQLLLAKKDPNDPEVKYVQQLNSCIVQSRSIVDSLLTVSRKTEMDFQRLDCNRTIRETVDLLSRSLQKSITISTRLADDLPVIEADPTQLSQILLNLVSNGCQAIPEGKPGTIEIATSFQPDAPDPEAGADDWILIQVSDTGQGMRPEVRERIFEPFFTTRQPGEGTGLGLSTVYSIVQSHRGRIEVSSQPGRGSRFRIHLPLRQPGFEAPEGEIVQAIEPDSDRSATGTVLVVDDEEAIREITSEHLEQHGFTVIEAENGQTACSVLDQQPESIDVVLLDLGMPGMSGEELIERIHELQDKPKIIVASGYTNHEIAADPLRFGVTDFLRKPFNLETALTAIQSALNSSSPTQSSALTSTAEQPA
jgi:signal transduction histidine kinase/ActR/RegA family two-component response regulator